MARGPRPEPILTESGKIMEKFNKDNALRLVGEVYERILNRETSKLKEDEMVYKFTYPNGQTRFDMAQPQVRHFENLLAEKFSRVLEVGAYLGGATVAFASGNNCEVHTVDNFCEAHEQENVGERCKERLSQYDNITLHELDARGPMFEKVPGQFDLIFVDGPHKADDNRRVVVNVLEKMADTCLLIFDDWDNWDVQASTLPTLDHYEKTNKRGMKQLFKIHLCGNGGPEYWELWHGLFLVLFSKT